ncbi:UNVERIFIED_CONTAM: hypothetical protein LK11_36495 [Mumia flava]
MWRTPGETGWYFATLPHDVSDDIDARTEVRAGFGSVRVRVRVGATEWETSVFPDRRRGSYVLPVKKAVRKAEGIAEGARIRIALTVLRTA